MQVDRRDIRLSDSEGVRELLALVDLGRASTTTVVDFSSQQRVRDIPNCREVRAPIEGRVGRAGFYSWLEPDVDDLRQLVERVVGAGEWIRFRVFQGDPPDGWSTWDPDFLWRSEISEGEVGEAILVVKLVDDGTAVLRAVAR